MVYLQPGKGYAIYYLYETINKKISAEHFLFQIGVPFHLNEQIFINNAKLRLYL